MTDKTKHKLKKKLKMIAFDDAMQSSATNIAAMGAKPADGVAPNSWEGMMQMLSKIERHGSPDEKAATVLAAAAWVWGHKEKCLYEKICDVIDAIEEDGNEDEENHAGEEEDHEDSQAAEEPKGEKKQAISRVRVDAGTVQ